MFTIIQQTAAVLENCMECLDKRGLYEWRGDKMILGFNPGTPGSHRSRCRKNTRFTLLPQLSASNLDMFAIALGRMADLFAKHAAEVGWIFESDLRGHFGDTILGVT